MLFGTKKLMPTAFKDFCDAMINAAENDALPQSLQLDNVFGITCQDVGDLCNDFEKETELELTGHIFICSDCGKTHLLLQVDYKEEEPEQLLQ